MLSKRSAGTKCPASPLWKGLSLIEFSSQLGDLALQRDSDKFGQAANAIRMPGGCDNGVSGGLQQGRRDSGRQRSLDGILGGHRSRRCRGELVGSQRLDVGRQ